MIPPEEPPLVAIVHPCEELVDLVQYELERLGLPTVTIVPDPPDEPEPLLRFLEPAPRLCVYGMAQPRTAALSCFFTVRRSLPASHFIVVTPVASRTDVWPGGALTDVVIETGDPESTCARIIESVRRALNVPPARIVRMPILTRRCELARSVAAETQAAARAARLTARALQQRFPSLHG